MEILVIIGIVIATIVFALIGFVSFLVWIFSSKKQTSGQSGIQKPTLSGDALASRRLLDHLKSKQEISETQYVQMRGFLDKNFPENFEAPTRLHPLERSRPSVAQNDDLVSEPAPPMPAQPIPTAEILTPNNDDVEEVVVAVVAESVSPAANLNLPVVPPRDALTAQSASAPQSVAPWDQPDPPPPTPRRSFGELMSGFMQEKNMRWGELTSGILIVLSAVGLVISLREELSDTIPYFSALLFMLITAAIHGAGIYTLKKWKLRSTSRGTLIIGLLLIPLNFVAACILSGGEERRALSDPWLWTAIVIGITAFSAMTWWSSKCLLRRGQLPMTIAVMGAGIGALLLNRLVVTADSSLQYLVFAIPVAASFLVGTCWFDSRQWVRQRWTERACNRLFLFLGVSAFAALSVLALVVVRAESNWVGLISTLPIFSVVCLVACCLGSIVTRGATGESKTSLRMAGLTLEVLGLILMAISLMVSISNPTVLAINSLVSGVGLIVMFIYQGNEKRLPIAWGVFAVGALAGLNLAIGKFGFDQWATPDQLKEAVFNGKSGLCLLAVGAGVIGIHSTIKTRVTDARRQKAFLVSGWISGGAIFLAGCLIAVVASFINQENVFDVMTASGLLMLAALASLAVNLIFARKDAPALEHLPNATSLLLIGGMAHTLLWNPVVGERFNELTGDIGAGWWTVLAVHGLTAAIAAAFLIRATGPRSSKIAGDLFAWWSVATTAILTIGLLSLIPFQSGWATLFAIVVSVSWFLIGRSWHRGGAFRAGDVMAEAFVGSTGLVVCVVVAELVSRFSWCPEFDIPKHWLVQLIGLSLWAIAWSVFMILIQKTKRLKWLHYRQLRLDQIVMFGGAIVAAVLVGEQLYWGAARELTQVANFDGVLSFDGSTVWVFATLGAIGMAFLVSMVELPKAIKGAGVIGVWMLIWAYGADSFDSSKSVASAIRWLLPIGGAVAAVMVSAGRKTVPGWETFRNHLNLPGPSRWSNYSTQQLINFALAIVAVVVMIISTFTISQVFLNGVESLGGPADDSWFSQIRAEISFGIPVAMVVGTFLLYAISERRSWLATMGSAVFQYMVVLAVILLFLSPDPAFATKRFVNILQSVAIGMTGYGFVWYWMRSRIEGRDLLVGSRKQEVEETIEVAEDPIEGERFVASEVTESPESTVSRRGWLKADWSPTGWISQIEVHTLINGLLVTSLAVLAMSRFYFVPDQPGDWISSVGSLMGVVAWAAFGVLAYCVWHENLAKQISIAAWVWLVGWMGLILVGLVAAVVDRNYTDHFIPWLPYRIVMIGAIVVSVIQTGLLWFVNANQAKTNGDVLARQESFRSFQFKPLSLAWPILLSAATGLTFAVRGAWSNLPSFWLYIGAIVVLICLTIAIGWLLRNTMLGFISIAVATLGVSIVLWKDPHGWVSGSQPYWPNAVAIAVGLIAIARTGFYIFLRRRGLEPVRRWFVAMPNTVVLMGSIWIFAAALLQVIFDSSSFFSGSFLVNPLGLGALATVIGLVVVSTWNDRARFRVVSRCLLSLAIAMIVASGLATTDAWQAANVNLSIALVIALWGCAWLNRKKYFQLTKRLGATRLVAFERSMGRQLPIYSLIVGSLVLFSAWIAIFVVELRPHRYMAAMVPFALAVGLGTQSNQFGRRWLQILTLCLVTIGVLFLGWADLTSKQMTELPMLRVLVRALIVLAGSMFVYGALVTRWVRPGDTWLKSLREMAVVTCGLAVACLVLVVMSEASTFREGVGCGLLVTESIAVALLVIGMIVGLITIAVRPENDPFALSLQGRMGYVYAAEFVGLALVAHLYFSMPWLFQIGIKDYWPYILMAICFAGVGVAHLLEKRKLTVLGQPLFNSAAVLPVIAALAIFAVDSKAEFDVVMLIAGMAYLMISYMNHSLLSGAAAIVFGNLALWIFFNRYPNFLSFFDHPQLWLIPPAVSVLVAGQLNRNLLTTGQLSTLRYICVAVIYVSSTMEIFIAGIGDQLWPPVLLAILAVIGIMSGIMFRVKAFLYFGGLFLLMAMITMVAHAHQRLDHVWPWWAFGIGLGIAILVMFGLFEKKKNEMKAVANQLRDWDA